MGAEESTLNCCARTRNLGSSRSSDFEQLDDDQEAPALTERPEKVAVMDVLKEGYLIKLNQRGVHKPRFFRVKTDLYYFGTKDDFIPKGVVLLCPNSKLPFVKDCPSVSPCAIEIRQYTGCFFRTEENADMGDWRSAIQKAIKSSSSFPAGETNGVLTPSNDGDYSGRQVIKEGYLMRRGFGSEWKRYWVVVREGILQYFPNNQTLAPKGTMDLTIDNDVCPDCPNVYTPHLNVALLHVSAVRSIVLIAESRDDQTEWIHAINAAIELQENEKMAIRKNPVGWKRTGKVKEVITPFIDLLRDPFRVEYFRQFMKDVGCALYLSFWLDVQQFKRLCKKEDRFYLKPCASVIFTKYLKEGGTGYVGLPSEFADKTITLLDDPNVNTFRETQYEVFRALRDDFYPIFLTSSHCAAMAAALFATIN